MSANIYRLIDFGGGRKLEQVAGRLIDRPSPAAEFAERQLPQQWRDADSVFDSTAKAWSHHTPWPESLLTQCDGFVMPVAPTPFGHIGIFPEQSDNWKWLRNTSHVPPESHALNLFAYTGASTMAMVSAGFSVAHVDAAKPNVAAARAAASANQWHEAPIRYLVDDAIKFAAREVRRERKYHTIVLDPPAYGHGPKGKSWRLERDVWPLLEDCMRLLTPKCFRMLVTGHSPDVTAKDVANFISQSNLLPMSVRSALRIESGRSQLKDESGRALDAGYFVRIAYQAT